jgi:retron-type reverse transcriptase
MGKILKKLKQNNIVRKQAGTGLKSLLRRFKKLKFEYVQCGRIDSIADGIARVYGLDGVQAGELLEFVPSTGGVIRGMALNLEKEFVGAVLFGNDAALKEGDLSRRTQSIISVPTGLFLRGRVLDPLGQPLDNKGSLPATKQELVERKAPGIRLRARIDSPMATGIRAVDSLVPIVAGCGRDSRFFSQRAGGGIRLYPPLGSPPRRGNGFVAMSTGSTQPSGSDGVGPPIPRNMDKHFLKLPKGAFASRPCAAESVTRGPIRLEKYGTSSKSEAMHLYHGTSTNNDFSERLWRVIGETRKRPAPKLATGNNVLATVEKASLLQSERSEPREINEITETSAVRHENLRYEDIVSEKALRVAWVQLKSNPGMMTPGASPGTFDGISEEWFKKASQALLEGNYEYPKKRRIQIPKPGKTETRPLTISNPRVKIIERAILNAIEPLFEGTWKWVPTDRLTYVEAIKDPRRSNNDVKSTNKGYFIKVWGHHTVWRSCSFGFRPNRSAHDALRAIKYWRKNTVWILDYDVRKAFDNVNRRRLANIFLNHINMPRLWHEIEKMMNAEIVALEPIFEKQGVGQGSVLSPFLFNMYMHELDNCIIRWKNECYQETKGNPEAIREYKTLMAKFSSSRVHTALKEFKTVDALDEARRAAKKSFYDKWGRSTGGQTGQIIQYVRYADDFIIGIVGSRKLARDTQRHVDTFLKSNLHLEVKKNNIVNRNEKGVRFLGFQIYLHSYKKKTRIKWNKFASIEKYKRRVLSRFQKSDARLASAAAHSMKGALLKTLKKGLETEGHKYNKTNTNALAQRAVSEAKSNPALGRWIQHFSTEQDRELSLATKFYDKNIADLEVPEGQKNVVVKIAELRKNFLHGIKSIIEDERIGYRDKRIKDVLSRREKALERSKLTNTPSAWSDIREETAIRAASSLSGDFLNQEQPRLVSIAAPVNDIALRLASKGFYHPIRHKPIANSALLNLSDPEIIKAYISLMYGIMNYYRPADNLSRVKRLVEDLRKSCVLTLARKHKKNAFWVYGEFGDDIEYRYDSDYSVSLPTREQVGNLTSGFRLGNPVGFDLEELLKKYIKRDHQAEHMLRPCAVLGCAATQDIQIHHVRKLARKIKDDEETTILNKDGRRVRGRTAMLSSIKRKQMPLCREHHLQFEKGKYSPLDVDYLKSLYNLKNMPGSKALENIYLHGFAVARSESTEKQNPDDSNTDSKETAE